jgi:hypothetical protein
MQQCVSAARAALPRAASILMDILKNKRKWDSAEMVSNG